MTPDGHSAGAPDEAASDYDDPALYDLENGWGPDDDFYLGLALRSGGPVLDLACGTGRLARALVRAGLGVTGVDRSRAMLDRARALDPAGRIELIRDDVAQLRLDRRFATILMTGHGFQHLLTRDAQCAVFRGVAAHLAPGGLFGFDVLNPGGQDFAARGFRPLPSFEAGDGRRIEGEAAVEWDPESRVATYRLRRRVPGSGMVRTTERLRYTTAAELDELIAGAGLERVARYGEWPDRPFRATSPEIVTLCRASAARPG